MKKCRTIGIIAAIGLVACRETPVQTPTEPRTAHESFFDFGRKQFLPQLDDAMGAAKNSKCSDAYKGAFAKGSLDVSIVFGYKDTRPSRFVADLFERSALVHQLTSPCPSTHFFACAFTRDEDDSDQFTRSLVSRGKTLLVRLRVAHSSIGPDDEINRKQAQQAWQSRATRLAFDTALAQADAVFYIGHSRDGGGPDFDPPRLTQDGHVDYESYAKRKDGLEHLIQQLEKRSASHPLLLGLMSCSSQTHFASEVLGQFPGLGLLSSRVLIYYTDALENTLFGLNAFLRQDCGAQFNAALSTRSSRSKGIQHEGFFTGTPKRSK